MTGYVLTIIALIILVLWSKIMYDLGNVRGHIRASEDIMKRADSDFEKFKKKELDSGERGIRTVPDPYYLLYKSNPVDHPDHYSQGFECIDAMKYNYGVERTQSFCLLNAFKYLWRCEAKHETPIEDINKSIWYLKKYLELEEALGDGKSSIGSDVPRASMRMGSGDHNGDLWPEMTEDKSDEIGTT